MLWNASLIKREREREKTGSSCQAHRSLGVGHTLDLENLSEKYPQVRLADNLCLEVCPSETRSDLIFAKKK